MEAVESTRGLIGAHHGAIVTVDDAGTPQNFVFYGVTPEEQQELFAWPGRALPARQSRLLPKVVGRIRSLGFQGFRCRSNTKH